LLGSDTAAQLTNVIVGSLYPIQVLQAQGPDIFVNRGSPRRRNFIGNSQANLVALKPRACHIC